MANEGGETNTTTTQEPVEENQTTTEQQPEQTPQDQPQVESQPQEQQQPQEPDGNEESAVHDFLVILEEHRKNCEVQGKYVEAEIAKNRLEELRNHEFSRRKEALRSRQIAERLGVEEAHMLEFQQFNAAWEAKFSEYEKKAQELDERMKNRHSNEIIEFQKKVEEQLQNARPKFSKHLLDIRSIQHTLAKQKEYAEAHKTKIKADLLEAQELDRYHQQAAQKNANKEQQYVVKQSQEIAALQKRIQTGRDELKKQRQIELERLLQRYQNVKNELESQQNIERLRAEKYLMKTLFPSGGSHGGDMAMTSPRLTKA